VSRQPRAAENATRVPRRHIEDGFTAAEREFCRHSFEYCPCRVSAPARRLPSAAKRSLAGRLYAFEAIQKPPAAR